MKTELGKRFAEYLNNTDEAILEQHWQNVQDMDLCGPTVLEYLHSRLISVKRTTFYCYESTHFVKNTTSNFSGSFFFSNIAA